jgi:hypothetical protein
LLIEHKPNNSADEKAKEKAKEKEKALTQA